MSFVTAGITMANAFQQVQAGKYAKGQADLQATQQDYQGKLEQEHALATAGIIRRAGRRQVGQATAAYAGAGVRVDQGSAAETERQINTDVEHDAFQALLEGGRRARGMQTEATMSRIDGGMRQAAGYVNAAGTVLGGMSKGMKASGWRTTSMPGFSGTQAPAPVENRDTYYRG